MGTLNVYNFISLNGFYKDAADGFSWGRHDGAEEKEFSGKNAQGGSALIFGRKTYELMAAFWPTDAGRAMEAATSSGMSAAEKIVFSSTLKKADWENTRVVRTDLAGEIKRLKEAGKALTILGSGSIIRQCADARLIDTLMVMINPIALGGGTPILGGIAGNLEMELADHRVFKSGRVLLTYRPKYA